MSEVENVATDTASEMGLHTAVTLWVLVVTAIIYLPSGGV